MAVRRATPSRSSCRPCPATGSRARPGGRAGERGASDRDAISDSQAGLLGWNGQLFDESVDDESVLANVSLYWLTGTAGRSIRHYYEDTQAPAAAADGDFRSIRRFAERDHAAITSWHVLPGVTGHYSARTHPGQLAADIRQFFRPIRSAPPSPATRPTRRSDHHVDRHHRSPGPA
jgi:hypothetical protein